MLSIGYYGLKGIKQLASDNPQDTRKSIAKDITWAASDLVVTGLALGAIGVGIAALFLAPGMAAFIGTQGSIILAAGGGGLLATSILGGAIIQHLAKKIPYFKETNSFQNTDTLIDNEIQLPDWIGNKDLYSELLQADDTNGPIYISRKNYAQSIQESIQLPDTSDIIAIRGDDIDFDQKKGITSNVYWENGHTHEDPDNTQENPTYEVDFFYASTTGVAFSIDEQGHSKPKNQYDLQNKVYETFATTLTRDLDGTTFQNLDEAKAFMRFQLLKLIQMPNKLEIESAYLQAAMSLALVVEINGSKYLLTAHYGDTFTVVQSSDDFTFLTNTNDKALDASVGKENESGFLIPKITATHVQKGDTIRLFTDGVGGFATKQEMMDAINEAKSEDKLLSTLRGKYIYQKDGGTRTDGAGNALVGAHGKTADYLDPKKPRYSDDDGFASMTVS